MVLTNVAQNSFVMHIKDDESCLFVHAVPKSDKTLLDVPTSTDGQNAVFGFCLDVYFFNDCQSRASRTAFYHGWHLLLAFVSCFLIGLLRYSGLVAFLIGRKEQQVLHCGRSKKSFIEKNA